MGNDMYCLPEYFFRTFRIIGTCLTAFLPPPIVRHLRPSSVWPPLDPFVGIPS